jgi:hypothetical protein
MIRQIVSYEGVMPHGKCYIFIGQPKTAKSSEAAKFSDKGYEGTLVWDFEGGCEEIPMANVIDIRFLNPPKRTKRNADGSIAIENGAEVIEVIPPLERGYVYTTGPHAKEPMPVYSVAEAINFTMANWESMGFQTLVMDTIDAFNDLVEADVVAGFGNDSMGMVAYGADYIKSRNKNEYVAKTLLKNFLEKFGGDMVLLTHSKTSFGIGKDGKSDPSIVVIGPELPNKLALQYCAMADAIGYVTIDKATEKAMVNFKTFDENTRGSRIRGLAKKKIEFSYESIKKAIINYRESA